MAEINMKAEAISVSQLNRYIKELMDGDMLLTSMIVLGEVSNVKHYSAGNQIYFTLKDENSQVSCVLFGSTIARLKVQPADGLTVIVHGRVTVYEKRGQYSLQVFFMEPQGIGALASAFELLKEKLKAEGLFDIERKKPLPFLPEKIAVVTSASGAVIKDILSIAKRRCPLTDIKLFPAVVQGALAPDSIVEQLKKAQAEPELEAIILARGGGSLEDLWAFNDERVARAIADCRLPVVSAVGHETDFTIADLVADLRAPTPSAAAELLIPNLEELLAGLEEDFKYALKQKYQNALQQFEYLKGQLQLLNPKAILERGYSITKKNGKIVKNATEIAPGDELETVFAMGRVISVVKG
ncbi:MAG: exodeoxyribonuclease VII large subunit [Candidatus Margulisiibacteriota bacterium]|jgi:exodeoxyribonuclease VII large subunit